MLARMAPEQIRRLLAPFLEDDALSDRQVQQVSQHLDLLLKWNSRVNLTSVAEPEQIMTRHFGESLFAARNLYQEPPSSATMIDLGSGAGFPGIPINIWAPELHVTLIESRQKKATFLREVIRTLNLDGLEVANQRAEALGLRADTVTLRAVEKFDSSLSIAANLLNKGGRLALLIGSPQVTTATSLLPKFAWDSLIPMPLSESRVLLIGRSFAEQE
jgi:16S rRNA (guanine527-N7)-methyltransferase